MWNFERNIALQCDKAVSYIKYASGNILYWDELLNLRTTKSLSFLLWIIQQSVYYLHSSTCVQENIFSSELTMFLKRIHTYKCISSCYWFFCSLKNEYVTLGNLFRVLNSPLLEIFTEDLGIFFKVQVLPQKKKK